MDVKEKPSAWEDLKFYSELFNIDVVNIVLKIIS